MMALLLVLILACAASLGLALAHVGQRPEQRRLERLSGGPDVVAMDVRGLLQETRPGLLERLVQLLAGSASKRSEQEMAPLRSRLVHAGYRGESAVLTYLGSRVALALALPLLFLMTTLAWSFSQLQLAAAISCAAGFGLILPSYWLDKRVEARQRALMLALPDALDLMVVCVEAGLGINASLKRIARDFRRTHPLLAEEFELANFETRAGKSTTDALRGLAARTGVAEVSTLVAMLLQTERFGTGLADTLRVHADAMRLRRVQRAEELANKAPLKMMFPTLFIFAAMLIIVIGPALLAMSRYFGQAAG